MCVCFFFVIVTTDTVVAVAVALLKLNYYTNFMFYAHPKSNSTSKMATESFALFSYKKAFNDFVFLLEMCINKQMMWGSIG